MKLLDRKSLVSQIMIIFLLFNIVVVTVFTAYITNQDRRETVKNVQDSMQAIASEKANTLSLIIGQIQQETEGFADFATEYIGKETNTKLSDDYVRESDNTLHRNLNDSDNSDMSSSIFFPAIDELSLNTIRTINATEKLDKMMGYMIKRNPYIQWVYIATEDGFLRLFPYSSIDIYDPGHLQKNDPFYLAANQKNNPQRKTVWTNPYMDYFGKGWVITCSVPLYQGDNFIGVACVDVCLDTLNDQFLKDFRLGEGGIVYLLQDNGNVIYHPGIVPKNGTRGKTFLTNIVNHKNLFSQYRNALKKILCKENGVISYRDENDKNHMIAHAKVVGQPWIVGVEIVQNQYFEINNLGKNNLWHFSLTLLLVYIIIAVFLYRQYSRPFDTLVSRAKTIAEGNFEYKEPIYNYTEIKILSEAFNTMSAKMKDYTENLIHKNIEIQSVIDSIGGMLMFVSPNMSITNINKKAMVALGKSKEELQGKKCHEILMGCDRICNACAIQKTIRTKSTQFSRIVLGEDILQNMYYPVMNADGQVTEIIVQSQKVTKQVLLEKELAQKEKMSEIGQLTAAIAHELKNPLAIIKGSSYLISAYAKEYENRELDESVNTVIQSTQNAEDVIYNLLNFSSSALTKTTQGNITKIVEQVILLTKRNSIAKNIKYITEFQPDPLIYEGNAEPFKSIIMNLVSNAINAIGEGGTITIQGYYYEDQMIISVKDDGKGVEDKFKTRIFEPFVTADTSGSGTGMGLWITKIMVEKMHGTIKLNSELGEKTEFIISVPLKNMKGR
ncbi:ATP-binding protein [Aminipila terrae]|uniref:histidine kinase n=1 Tax=Aminipila terrae TaxID=2697030 RepID=A0A6P1MQM8_9FIRM|nr:cache domain-containing protein [Aminipila terrae]QHI73305.1 PAS domain-containing protein [Aminipila terrae]